MLSPLELLVLVGVVGMAFGPKKWRGVFAMIFVTTLVISYLTSRA